MNAARRREGSSWPIAAGDAVQHMEDIVTGAGEKAAHSAPTVGKQNDRRILLLTPPPLYSAQDHSPWMLPSLFRIRSPISVNRVYSLSITNMTRDFFFPHGVTKWHQTDKVNQHLCYTFLPPVKMPSKLQALTFKREKSKIKIKA